MGPSRVQSLRSLLFSCEPVTSPRHRLLEGNIRLGRSERRNRPVRVTWQGPVHGALCSVVLETGQFGTDRTRSQRYTVAQGRCWALCATPLLERETKAKGTQALPFPSFFPLFPSPPSLFPATLGFFPSCFSFRFPFFLFPFPFLSLFHSRSLSFTLVHSLSLSLHLFLSLVLSPSVPVAFRVFHFRGRCTPLPLHVPLLCNLIFGPTSPFLPLIAAFFSGCATRRPSRREHSRRSWKEVRGREFWLVMVIPGSVPWIVFQGVVAPRKVCNSERVEDRDGRSENLIQRGLDSSKRDHWFMRAGATFLARRNRSHRFHCRNYVPFFSFPHLISEARDTTALLGNLCIYTFAVEMHSKEMQSVKIRRRR